ncbi:hypothetical protein QBC34DRAFT_417526 [Podospora aff. communis PSN243]|uniref:HD/PDEase domain-containing protein n=1 Tax=Podospora aff. communis PSN243 TaxID=3040156 RepID=A0AAV9G7J3_9PEZI|nr:hypothetical protein QBC34DRAFT_417526 [Podospora aff. communis PSN243]
MCNGSEPPSPGIGTGTITAAVRALVPNHPACAEALALAKASLPASILYHSFRVYMYAQAFLRIFQDSDTPKTPTSASFESNGNGNGNGNGHRNGNGNAEAGHDTKTPAHVLFVACILHDVGTAQDHDSIPERFEIVSADVAARVLRNHGISEALIHDAWLAMSLHTSPGIAERLGGTVRALRVAVRADFGSYPLPPPETLPGGTETMNMVRWKLPRLEIEKDLGDAVVRQAVMDPQKAPGSSWPGDLLRAKRAEPDWEGINKAF